MRQRACEAYHCASLSLTLLSPLSCTYRPTANMKVITAIYLHCRPDLRDEWLTGIDVDADVEESLPHEQALRQLVRFFNTKHYGAFAPQLHRRSSSANHAPPEFGSMADHSPGGGGGGEGPGPYGEHGRPLSRSSSSSSSSGEDVFPPTRSVSSFDIDAAFRTTYSSAAAAVAAGEVDDFGDDYEVDDLLLYPRGGTGGGADGGVAGVGAGLGLGGGSAAMGGDGDGDSWDRVGLDWFDHAHEDWARLGEIVGEYDDISDSESVGSLSGLLARARGDGAYGGAGASGAGAGAGGGPGSTMSDGSVSEFDIDEAVEQERSRHEWEHIR